MSALIDHNLVNFYRNHTEFREMFKLSKKCSKDFIITERLKTRIFFLNVLSLSEENFARNVGNQHTTFGCMYKFCM